MKKKVLREILDSDKEVFEQYSKNFRSTVLLKFTSDHIILIHKYLVLFRYCHYYKEAYEEGDKLAVIPYTIYAKRMNMLGNKLGFYISPSAKIGKGFWIYHHGTIIINGNVKIGDYCTLHGNNCIGNSGAGRANAPQIGDHCDIGFGAVLIGNIVLGDHITVGANAVVNKDCKDSNVLLVGVPATAKESNDK